MTLALEITPEVPPTAPNPAEERALFFQIGGMSCAGCAQAVQSVLQDLPGVKVAMVNFATQQGRVIGTVDPETILQAVARAGFTGTPLEHPWQGPDLQAETNPYGRRLWVAGIPLALLMGVMVYCLVLNLPHNQHHQVLTLVLAFPVVFVGGWETHRASWAALRRGSPSMDVLISLGTVPTYALGLTGIPEMTLFVEVAAMVMGFHLLSRFLEYRGRTAAYETIRGLLLRQAPRAHWYQGGLTEINPEQVVDVPVQALQVGDCCVVKPGEVIPTDGEVIWGQSSVDESLATGESWPVPKGIGSPLIGGTINKEGILLLRVTRIGAETFLAQMIQLLQEAQGSRLPIQQVADRVTRVFVPVVILLAGLSFWVWWRAGDLLHPWVMQMAQVLPWVHGDHNSLIQAVLVMVAVLVVACPCALGLATPMAVLVGSGRAAQMGIVIRRGDVIQRLQEVDTVIFDKTGTLTLGQPQVSHVWGDPQEVLSWAAAAEQGSEHPLAKAICQAHQAYGDPLPGVQQAEIVPGQGIAAVVDGHQVRVGSATFLHLEIPPEIQAHQAAGETILGVMRDQTCLGWVAVRDPVKPEAAGVVARLQAQGLQVHVVSGDHPATVAAVAHELGIPGAHGGVLPAEKVALIREWQAQGRRVLMVGDGLNDAPALQQAHVGIALGTGTDLAISAADLILVSGDLRGIERAQELAAATFQTIRQNLGWAMIYNILAIPLAAAGILHPLMAEVAMALSSLSVIANSLALQRRHA